MTQSYWHRRMCRAISLAKGDEHHKICDTAGIAKDLLARRWIPGKRAVYRSPQSRTERSWQLDRLRCCKRSDRVQRRGKWKEAKAITCNDHFACSCTLQIRSVRRYVNAGGKVRSFNDKRTRGCRRVYWEIGYAASQTTRLSGCRIFQGPPLERDEAPKGAKK